MQVILRGRRYLGKYHAFSALLIGWITWSTNFNLCLLLDFTLFLISYIFLKLEILNPLTEILRMTSPSYALKECSISGFNGNPMSFNLGI